jgi:hypothetical protein
MALLAALAAACGGAPRGPAPWETRGEAWAAWSGEGDTRIQTLRARAWLEYYGPGVGRARLRQAIVARRPADLRIETISPMDTSLGVLVADADHVLVWEVGADLAVQGPPTADTVGRLGPVALAPEDLLRVLSGSMPGGSGTLPTDPDQAPTWDRAARCWAVEAPLADGGRMRWCGGGPGDVRRALHLDARGRTVWEVRLGAMREVPWQEGEEALFLPTVIRFLAPGDRVDATWDIERWTLNPELDDALFTFRPPPHVEIRVLRPR